MFRLKGYLGEWYRRLWPTSTGVNPLGGDFPGSGHQFGPSDSWRCYTTGPRSDPRGGSDTICTAVTTPLGLYSPRYRPVSEPAGDAGWDAAGQCGDRDW